MYNALFCRQWCTAERQDQQETLDFINRKMKDVTAKIKTKIQNITEEVELQVKMVKSQNFIFHVPGCTSSGC